MKEKAIYFPGLNGLRTIAAMGVMLSHITHSLDKYGLDSGIFGRFKDGKPIGLALAGSGVTIFFVLSGFLITYLLQAEQKEHGDIDIKKFYFRRILRIWPLYYLYLIVSLIVMLICGMSIDMTVLPYYILYGANIPFIMERTILPVGHYWSLGVEEQFYVFWPWVNKKFERYLVPFILVFIALQVGATMFFHFFHPGWEVERLLTTTRFHCMMIGALGAIYYRRNNALFLKLTDNKITQAICWSAIFMLIINKFHIASVIDMEIISVVSVAVIIGQIRIQNRLINLDRPIFNFLGKISYGIYVIHPLMMMFFDRLPIGHLDMPHPLKYLVIYGSISGITILMAYLSYHYYEKPFLKLKKKFVVVDSSAVNPDAAS
jgi:peptidoglycan/LPS O-acetylase OafA/YrhL